MIHFTKDKARFGRFALELIFSNSNLRALKKIGVDLESAIFEGFKSTIPSLNRLVCARHLMQRDEPKLLKLLERTGRNAAEKNHASSEILKDICGYREGNYYEYDLAELVDCEDFIVKIESLKCRWEALRPGFHV